MPPTTLDSSPSRERPLLVVPIRQEQMNEQNGPSTRIPAHAACHCLSPRVRFPCPTTLSSSQHKTHATKSNRREQKPREKKEKTDQKFQACQAVTPRGPLEREHTGKRQEQRPDNRRTVEQRNRQADGKKGCSQILARRMLANFSRMDSRWSAPKAGSLLTGDLRIDVKSDTPASPPEL